MSVQTPSNLPSHLVVPYKQLVSLHSGSHAAGRAIEEWARKKYGPRAIAGWQELAEAWMSVNAEPPNNCADKRSLFLSAGDKLGETLSGVAVPEELRSAVGRIVRSLQPSPELLPHVVAVLAAKHPDVLVPAALAGGLNTSSLDGFVAAHVAAVMARLAREPDPDAALREVMPRLAVLLPSEGVWETIAGIMTKAEAWGMFLRAVGRDPAIGFAFDTLEAADQAAVRVAILGDDASDPRPVADPAAFPLPSAGEDAVSAAASLVRYLRGGDAVHNAVRTWLGALFNDEGIAGVLDRGQAQLNAGKEG